ncbi:grasp-with-spasm system A modified peptide [Chryseobacterium soli]|uniref:grasp-with-spasm system A modified peptide n=1 Tax=Chryseobacterium soli TaxID=445961 RepID=UPI002955DC55|nr:grasp-with-spasm system A modified peptide [Chryseobacterium soli]MDV7698419.1 grasp-with-spasm system A modified peptide [Chryseobacterium soli]
MKKLTGMKNNFSSLENKKMKNLQSITGGATSNRNAASGYMSSEGPVTDTDYYTDDVSGVWNYKSRTKLTVGAIEPVDSF